MVAEFPVRASQSGGATAELEILRGDLAHILVDASTAGGHTDYRYGDQIAELADGADEVDVAFESGERQSFDLVIVADGMRSSTREIVFGGEAMIRPLGMETSYFTIPRTATDTLWWNWYNEPGGLAVSLRPDSHGWAPACRSSVPTCSPASWRPTSTTATRSPATSRSCAPTSTRPRSCRRECRGWPTPARGRDSLRCTWNGRGSRFLHRMRATRGSERWMSVGGSRPEA